MKDSRHPTHWNVVENEEGRGQDAGSGRGQDAGSGRGRDAGSGLEPSSL